VVRKLNKCGSTKRIVDTVNIKMGRCLPDRLKMFFVMHGQQSDENSP